MPVIAADYEDLVQLVGRRVPREELIARVPMMGGAFEGTDEAGRLLFEFFPNRPDLVSVEGLARACRAFFDVRPGLPRFEVRPGQETVRVEPSVAKIRPVIGFARVEGLSFNEARLTQLLELQERLTTGPGRRRRKVAIGIHDAAPVRAPFTYKAVARDAVRFVPLGMDRALTPEQILAEHEKGRIYGPLLDGHAKVPLIVDAQEQVLSLPPIINGQLTALTNQTRSVLVDVTGTEARAVLGVLNIVVTSLAERGGRLSSLAVQQGRQTLTTPDLTPTETGLTYRRVRELLGLRVNHESARTHLGRMGHDVEPAGASKATVLSPAYRMDLLHPDDLVEDLGIGYGFEKFEPRLPQRANFGSVQPRSRATRRARTLLLGLGFTEVVTLSITGKRDLFELLRTPPSPVVEIANPLTQEQAVIRPMLLPSLLGILRANKHRELPQSIFEAGLAIPDPGHGAKTQLRAAAVRISADASYSECKGLVEVFLRDAGIAATLERGSAPGFIEGRAALLRSPQGAEIGFFGELRPDVITNFELGAPVIGFEVVL